MNCPLLQLYQEGSYAAAIRAQSQVPSVLKPSLYDGLTAESFEGRRKKQADSKELPKCCFGCENEVQQALGSGKR